MKIKYFPVIRTVSGRVSEKFLSVTRLATGLAKNIKFKLFGCLEALEDCK